jgi:hypothetical protein
LCVDVLMPSTGWPNSSKFFQNASKSLLQTRLNAFWFSRFIKFPSGLILISRCDPEREKLRDRGTCLIISVELFSFSQSVRIGESFCRQSCRLNFDAIEVETSRAFNWDIIAELNTFKY